MVKPPMVENDWTFFGGKNYFLLEATNLQDFLNRNRYQKEDNKNTKVLITLMKLIQQGMFGDEVFWIYMTPYDKLDSLTISHSICCCTLT